MPTGLTCAAMALALLATSSKLACRGCDGKVVSSAKIEFGAITNHFGISVDNAVNILMEGTS